MSKIYVVISSEGEYEDYHEYNEKAFINKEDAEEYCKQLDKKHDYKPEFVTDEFEEAYDEAYESAPKWGYLPDPVKNKKDYLDTINKRLKIEFQHIVSEMNKQGFNVTEDMIKEYEEWDYGYKWHPCKIEEIELV